MEEGKWYKCIETGSGVSKGSYYQCVEKNAGHNEDFWSEFTSVYGENESAYNRRFDPTPHTRTTFPNMPNLIERVSKIDPAAAEWLEFGDHSGCVFNTSACSLSTLFAWPESPQDVEFWRGMEELLKQQNRIERSAPMTKEYEYESTTADITLNGISNYNPCDTEFGKFTKWFLARKALVLSSKDIVNLLVSDQRFSWLNWLSENTPFVKRTEKKAFRFTPDTIRLAFSEDGMINSALEIKGTDGRWWTALTFCRDGNIYYALDCKNLPVQMDGDKIAIK